MGTLAELLILFMALALVATPFVLAARMRRSLSFRLGLCLVLFTGLFVTWVNLAVGIVGEPENLANLPYFAIVAMTIAAALLARHHPRALARVMLAAALAQALLGLVSAGADLGAPVTPRWSLMLFNGMLAGAWLMAGYLFRRDQQKVPG